MVALGAVGQGEIVLVGLKADPGVPGSLGTEHLQEVKVGAASLEGGQRQELAECPGPRQRLQVAGWRQGLGKTLPWYCPAATTAPKANEDI